MSLLNCWGLLTGKLQALVQRRLGLINQCHRNPGFLSSHQGNSQTLERPSATNPCHTQRICIGILTICPDPITPSDFTSAAAAAEVELKAREATDGPRRLIVRREDANMMIRRQR